MKVLVTLLLLVSLCYASDLITVDENNVNHTITVTKGDTVLVSLHSFFNAGYLWKLDEVDSKILSITTSEGESVFPGRFEAGETRQVFAFDVISTGKTDVVIRCRGFNKVLHEYKITVTVK